MSSPQTLPLGGIQLSDCYLRRLTDERGIMQFANGRTPDRTSGYCVDDAARALLAALRLGTLGIDCTDLVDTYLTLLSTACPRDGATGMYNMADDLGQWSDEPHPGDHAGRAVWALSMTIMFATEAEQRDRAQSVLDLVTSGWASTEDLRPDVYATLGLGLLPHVDGDQLGIVERCAHRLVVAASAAEPSWFWFEPALSYDNARLPQAAMVAGERLGRTDVKDVGHRTLQWLSQLVGDDGGSLRVPGHRGLRPGEPLSNSGDEQPLDVAALLEAHLTAASTAQLPADARPHADLARQAAEWFVGANRLRLPLYDADLGACHDGLGQETINGNCGAESTVCAIHALSLHVLAGR